MLKRYTGYKRLLALAALSGGAAPVEYTATGNPLTFTTDIAKPLKSLLIPFTPIQSGTGDPSPQNIRPIMPWDGLKAQLSGENVLNPTAPQIIDVNGQGVNRYGQVFRSAGKYTIVNNSENYDYLYFKKVKNDLSSYGGANTVNHGENAKVTLEENYMLYVYRQSGSDMSDFCVNIGEDTVFHAYNGNTNPVSFPSPVYGGEHEAVSGKLMDAFKCVDLGSKSWKLRSENQSRQVWECVCNDAKFGREGNTYTANAISSEFSLTTSSAAWSVGKFAPALSTNDKVFIFSVPAGSYANATECKEAMDGIQLCYELIDSAKQEIQLTPQQLTALLGNNTIWSDADGQMTAVFLKKG